MQYAGLSEAVGCLHGRNSGNTERQDVPAKLHLSALAWYSSRSPFKTLQLDPLVYPFID